MKKTISILALFALGLMMSACGNSNLNGGMANNIICPTGTNSINGICPDGSIPIYPGVNGGIHTFYDTGRTYGGSIRIENRGAYKEFLKYAMGVCDRATLSLGAASCDGWIAGNLQLDVRVDTSRNSASLGFTATAPNNWYYYYLNLGVFTNAWVLNPLILNQGTYSLINNSKGFELRSYGSSANGGGLKLIQLQAKNTTIDNNYIAYELYFPYNGQPTKFATGRLIRR